MSFISDGYERCEIIAMYIIDNGCTVRAAANRFGISKSTVHKDVTERLPTVNMPLRDHVRVVLERNKAERHLRGGEATRLKYLRQSSTASEMPNE